MLNEIIKQMGENHLCTGFRWTVYTWIIKSGTRSSINISISLTTFSSWLQLVGFYVSSVYVCVCVCLPTDHKPLGWFAARLLPPHGRLWLASLLFIGGTRTGAIRREQDPNNPEEELPTCISTAFIDHLCVNACVVSNQTHCVSYAVTIKWSV